MNKETNMTKFDKSKFSYHGGYLMYGDKFVARFKHRGPITKAVFLKQLLKNHTVEEYLQKNANGMGIAPLTDYISESWNDVSDAHLVLRTNPFNQETDVLATVGKRYKPVQNEELFAFADAIHDANADCRWESAGSLKKGKVVFGTVDIPRTMVIDPQGANDETKLYLIVWTSHDGSVAVQAAVTPVRVVCQNTLNLAMRNAKSTSIRNGSKHDTNRCIV